MSIIGGLYGEYERHKRNEGHWACLAVEAIQKGGLDLAKYYLEWAATERHLAFEMLETWKLASAARGEFFAERAGLRVPNAMSPDLAMSGRA